MSCTCHDRWKSDIVYTNNVSSICQSIQSASGKLVGYFSRTPWMNRILIAEHALNSQRPTLTHLANGWICINVSLVSWYIYNHLYTFPVWVISCCPMKSLICKQTSLSPCAMKAPSWPQMTLNVFWLEELEVRGRMLEYEDAKGRQCYFFWFAVLLFYSWSWWMYPFLQRRSKHGWDRCLEWFVWNLL